MRLTLGYIALAVWVIGFLAALARIVWDFAVQYHEDASFRARADSFFTRRRPGPTGWIARILTTALIIGSGILLNAAMWPTSWLFDWYDDRRERRRTARAADPEA